MWWASCGVTAMVVTAMVVGMEGAVAPPETAAPVASLSRGVETAEAKLARMDFGISLGVTIPEPDAEEWANLEYGDLLIGSLHAEQVPTPGAAVVGVSLLAAVAARRKR